MYKIFSKIFKSLNYNFLKGTAGLALLAGFFVSLRGQWDARKDDLLWIFRKEFVKLKLALKDWVGIKNTLLKFLPSFQVLAKI